MLSRAGITQQTIGENTQEAPSNTNESTLRGAQTTIPDPIEQLEPRTPDVSKSPCSKYTSQKASNEQKPPNTLPHDSVKPPRENRLATAGRMRPREN